MNQKLHQVYIDVNAFSKIMNHAKKNLSKEVGGFLIGCLYDILGKITLYILDAVPAKSVTASFVRVEMHPESSIEVIDSIQKHSNKFNSPLCVGWYHSHPFGSIVHPSGTDEETMKTFFDKWYQVSIIVDPKSDDWNIYQATPSGVKSIKSLCYFVILLENSSV